MLTPRYYFTGEFCRFYDYFLSHPHTEKHFAKGEYLWRPGQPHEKIHYIKSGALMHYADHENGHRKIISFHGEGSIFPGYHTCGFKIELSLTTVALTEISVLEFTRQQFSQMFEENTELSEQVVNWYSMYVNRLLFETVHQEYNSSFVKICNLLYLLTVNNPQNHGFRSYAGKALSPQGAAKLPLRIYRHWHGSVLRKPPADIMCFYYKAQKQKRLLQMIQKKTKTAITCTMQKLLPQYSLCGEPVSALPPFAVTR